MGTSAARQIPNPAITRQEINPRASRIKPLSAAAIAICGSAVSGGVAGNENNRKAKPTTAALRKPLPLLPKIKSPNTRPNDSEMTNCQTGVAVGKRRTKIKALIGLCQLNADFRNAENRNDHIRPSPKATPMGRVIVGPRRIAAVVNGSKSTAKVVTDT